VVSKIDQYNNKKEKVSMADAQSATCRFVACAKNFKAASSNNWTWIDLFVVLQGMRKADITYINRLEV